MSLAQTYRGRRVLLTGHTGFKGSWLALWLDSIGAEVMGVGLDPEGELSHWNQLRLTIRDERLDIRNASKLTGCIIDFQPEVVFHLAAQSLVRRSYAHPLATWSTNVMGTANLLDACRSAQGLKAIVVITTDKCYHNEEWVWGYRETDKLGGKDPYSASKAASELLAASYRSAYFSGAGAPLLATARAGNVVGGGDWSADRLIPDLVRASMRKTVLEIRNPRATRPWQHVLDSLSGYLQLGAKLIEGRCDYAEAWNFGPAGQSAFSVAEVLEKMRRHWPALGYRAAGGEHPPEAGQLRLDSAKAQARLGFAPVWDLDQTLAMTASWYREFLEHGTAASRTQLSAYLQTSGL